MPHTFNEANFSFCMFITFSAVASVFPAESYALLPFFMAAELASTLDAPAPWDAEFTVLTHVIEREARIFQFLSSC